jgi:hypothetical protein
MILLSDDRSSKSAVGRAHRAVSVQSQPRSAVLVLRHQLDVLSRKPRPCAVVNADGVPARSGSAGQADALSLDAHIRNAEDCKGEERKQDLSHGLSPSARQVERIGPA